MKFVFVLIGLLGASLGAMALSSGDFARIDMASFPAQKIVDRVLAAEVWPSLPSFSSNFEFGTSDEYPLIQRAEKIFASLDVKYRRDFKIKASEIKNIVMDTERHLILVEPTMISAIVHGLSESDGDMAILTILAHELSHYYYDFHKSEVSQIEDTYPAGLTELQREDLSHARVEMIACRLLFANSRTPQEIESGFRNIHSFISAYYEHQRRRYNIDESFDLEARRAAVETCLSGGIER